MNSISWFRNRPTHWCRWMKYSRAPWRPDLRAVLAAALCVALPAQAATTCSAGDISLNLGAYDGFNATPTDSSGVFVVTCARAGGPPTTTITMALGPSQGSGGIVNRAARHATAPDLLSYNLYRDASRLLVWGNTPGTNTVSQSISLSNNTSGTLTFTIFGRIDALQDVRAGAYSDRLTITITF